MHSLKIVWSCGTVRSSGNQRSVKYGTEIIPSIMVRFLKWTLRSVIVRVELNWHSSLLMVTCPASGAFRCEGFWKVSADLSYLLSLVFVSLSLVLSTYCVPVLIFCFYLYLNLWLAREFTYCHISVIRLALSNVFYKVIVRVYGVTADLRYLVLISCSCA